MAFSLRKDIVWHDAFKTGLAKLQQIHERSKTTGHASGLMITAPSGVGKSRLISHFKSLHPPVEEKDRIRIPVLVVETPPIPTVKGLVGEIQIALAGNTIGGTTEFQTHRVRTLLRELKVEILIIDEFQHFVDRKLLNEFGKAADWLKSLINAANIPVVIFGLPRSVQVLEINEQLRRRFSSRYQMRAFDFENDEQRKEFKGVLKGIQKVLPLKCETNLHEHNLALKFYFASDGIFDYLIKIIDGALEVAETADLNTLTMSMLAEAFVNKVWDECPEHLNPFSEKFINRHLTQSGEPFAPAELNSPTKPEKDGNK